MKFITKTAVAALAVAASATATLAEDKHFDGAYLGADIGLTDGGEFYYGANLGLRKQTESNMVFGVEGRFGDYAVSETFNILGTPVEAGINYAWAAHGYVGWVFGEDKRNLFKVGGGYNEFHVKATAGNVSDGASTGDFGAFIGYERASESNVNFRLQLDYLKIEDSHGGQLTAGFNYQF